MTQSAIHRGAAADEVAAAIAAGLISDRVWLYANYDCNLACAYCLASSSPKSKRRQLTGERMVEIADEAKALGFLALGVTGGEPFLRPWLVDTLVKMAARLPVLVLSNGTLFKGKRLAAMAALAGVDVTVQMSLDRLDPAANDELRAAGNHEAVVQAISALVGLGVRVRVASTVNKTDAEGPDFAAFVRGLGVAEGDHITRPIVRRGRAAQTDLGVRAEVRDLEPELTISADGAFWGPFGPTVQDEKLDTDLRISKDTRPLAVPARRLVDLANQVAEGHDTTLGIR